MRDRVESLSCGVRRSGGREAESVAVFWIATGSFEESSRVAGCLEVAVDAQVVADM